MPQDFEKLEALRLVSEELRQFEIQRQERIARGDKAAEVDRDIAQMTLNSVVTFFLDLDIESSPLARLLAGLDALSAGSSASPMFAPAATPHRRPDAPVIEGVKGRLAATMEFRQQTGLTRKEAGEWVVEHIPSELKRRFGSPSRAAVDSWLVKWGGEIGADPGSGREGYLAMRALLTKLNPSEADWEKILRGLVKSLPP